MIVIAITGLVTVALILFYTGEAKGSVEKAEDKTAAVPSIGGELQLPVITIKEAVITKPSIKSPTKQQLTPPGVPMLLMRKNAGQNPKPPTLAIYMRFPAQINRVVSEVNAASAGLNVGLNSWFRTPGEAGEELTQHLIACALDIQGPDQERVAMALKARGWTIVRQSNKGVKYTHVHCQLEPAGYLTRLGIAAKDLV